ncbi:LOW QUALITY PROTEIN: diacylglycerol kinase theta [Menidia menidia]
MADAGREEPADTGTLSPLVARKRVAKPRENRPLDTRSPEHRIRGHRPLDRSYKAGFPEHRPLDNRSLDPKSLEPQILDPKSPDTRSLNPKSPDSWSQDPQTLDPKSLDPKSLDPHSPDPRSLDPKSQDSRTSASHPLDTRSHKTRSLDPKSPDSWPLDTKSLDTKSLESKSPDHRSHKTRSSDSWSLDTKSLDTRSLDSRPLDTKSLDTKSLDTRPLDPGSPASRPPYRGWAPGHSFRRVTLTKPTFCHSCSDFVWGLVGFLCEVCNLMCHEKCLKTLRTVCSCMTPTLVQVPAAHCFGPAAQKKRFCCVCRKHTEGGALRCEVCELHVHADCAAFSCADCRRAHLDGTLEQDTFHHHWREGNLSSASRCDVCRRSCGSSEVLAGMRCQWCGITTHAACYLGVAAQCDLGRLRSLTLHPAAVRLQTWNLSKTHSYRIQEPSSPETDAPPPAAASRDAPPQAPDSGKQQLRLFDGDEAAQHGVPRLVSICRATGNQEVVEAGLRAFYLPGDPLDFELHELDGPLRLHGDDLLNHNGVAPDNRGPLRGGGDAWVLRARATDSDVIKVYAGWPSSAAASVFASVSDLSTAASVLNEVLSPLGRQGEDVSDFSLLEIYMGSRQVQKQMLSPQQKILDRLQEIRKASLRRMNQTRFYVVGTRNRAVQVDLLIGGFPPLLLQEDYVQLVQEHLATKDKLVTITHVYGSQGAVALQVSCFSEAERIYTLAKDTSISSRPLSALLIPEIQLGHLGNAVCPLLVFVNPKSGGLKGRELLHSFRKLLNPHQVFDITNGGPLAGLHTFREVPRFRVLVCGGDGTVGWVLGVLEAIRHRLACREPPIGIVPLGTGNDLARVLRWGAGYSGEDPLHILASVDEADEVLMDRWTILLDAQDMSEDSKENNFLEPPKIVQMNNYFGIGIDAELSLDFHLAREDEPGKFTSRFHNKGVYVKVGLQKLSRNRSLQRELTLLVDSQPVALPAIEGLIFLNIPSWGSGADLWGSEVDGRHQKPSINDGLLEVVGVTGVVHMGKVQGGLGSGIRIAQGSYIRLTVSRAVPVQVDGEPWIQPPGHIIISAAGPKVRMLKKSKQKQKKSSAALKDGGLETSPSRNGAH